MPRTNSIRAIRREAEELSDGAIERLVNFGRREAAVLDEMEAAARTGNRERTWELAQELCRLQDEAHRDLPPAA
jgi:hypothetical protein